MRERRMISGRSMRSSRLSKCSDSEHLFYHFLVLLADDEGRGEGEPEDIKHELTSVNWSEDKIGKMLAHLSQIRKNENTEPLIYWYKDKSTGLRYYAIPDFDNHQQGSWQGKHKKDSEILSPYDLEQTEHCFATDTVQSVAKRSKEKLNISKDKIEVLSSPLKEIVEKVHSIPQWPKTDVDKDITLFTEHLKNHTSATILAVLEDLHRNQLTDSAYTSRGLRKAFNTWLSNHIKWNGEEPEQSQPYILDGKESPYGPGVLRKFESEGKIKQVADRTYVTIDQTKDPPGDMSKAKESVNALAERMGVKK